jgi:hypothetical protein
MRSWQAVLKYILEKPGVIFKLAENFMNTLMNLKVPQKQEIS